MYRSFSEIPYLISERVILADHAALLEGLQKKYDLTDEQVGILVDAQKEILLGSEKLTGLKSYLQLHLKELQPVTIQGLACDLVGGYFLLFQDFLGDVSPCLVECGASSAAYQQRAEEVLNYHKRLGEFFDTLFRDAQAEDIDDAKKERIIDITLDYTEDYSTEETFRALVKEVIGDEEKAERVSDEIERYHSGGDISPAWAKYYRNEANSVLKATSPLYSFKLPASMHFGVGGEAQQAYQEYVMRSMLVGYPHEVLEWLSSPETAQGIEDIEKNVGVTGIGDLVLNLTLRKMRMADLPLRLRALVGKKVELVAQIRDAIQTLCAPVMPFLNGEVMQTPTREPVASPTAPSVLEQRNISTVGALDYRLLAFASLVKAGINGLEGEKLQRAIAILVTRVRDIRSIEDTTQRLQETFVRGGADFSAEQASRAVSYANEFASGIKQGSMPSVDEQTRRLFVAPEILQKKQEALQERMGLEIEMPSFSKDYAQELANSAVNDLLASIGVQQVATATVASKGFGRSRQAAQVGVKGYDIPSSSTSHVSQKPRLSIVEQEDGVPMIVEHSLSSQSSRMAAPQIMNRTVPQARRASMGSSIVLKKSPSALSPHKIAISDVKVSERLTDPVEELRTLTVRDFRRLSPDPMAAVKRIYQKITLLEQESLSKRAAAVQAWHESEVHLLYTAIGRESFGKGVPIEEATAAREREGKPTLTEKEFDALMELNEMLRFS